MNQIERLGGFLEETIRCIKDEKLDPTSALRKVAEAHKLSASDVEFVAGQVNTSRHLVHMVKSAGAERIAEFPLADASKITAGMDSSKVCINMPTVVPSLASGIEDRLRKTGVKGRIVRTAASREVEHQVLDLYRLIKTTREQLRDAVLRTATAMRNDLRIAEHRTHTGVSELASMVKRMPPADRQRFYGRIIKGFGATGHGLLMCVRHAACIDDELPTPGSKEVIFPPEPVYRLTSKVVGHTAQAARLRNNIALLTRTAEGDSFTEDFLAHLTANTVSAAMSPSSAMGALVGQGDQDLTAKRDDAAAQVDLSLQAQAQLRGLRTRRAFMDAVLNDPNLRGYPLRRLTRAFNDASQTDPTIVTSPPRLRSAMMQMLASPVLDPFMLKTLVETGEKQQKIVKADSDARVRRAEDARKLGETFADKTTSFAVDVGKRIEEGAKVQAAQSKARTDARKESWDNLKKSLFGETEGPGIFKGIVEIREARAAQRAKENVQHQVRKALDGLDPADLQAGIKAGGFANRAAMEQDLTRLAMGKKQEGTVLGGTIDNAFRATEAISASVSGRTKEATDAAKARQAASPEVLAASKQKAVDSLVNMHTEPGTNPAYITQALDLMASKGEDPRALAANELTSTTPAPDYNAKLETFKVQMGRASALATDLSQVDKMFAQIPTGAAPDAEAEARQAYAKVLAGAADPADRLLAEQEQKERLDHWLQETAKQVRADAKGIGTASQQATIAAVLRTLPSGIDLKTVAEAYLSANIPARSAVAARARLSRANSAFPDETALIAHLKAIPDPDVQKVLDGIRDASKRVAAETRTDLPLLFRRFV